MESTAPVGEVNGYEDSDENRSPNDPNYRVAVHGPRLHVAGLLANGGAQASFRIDVDQFLRTQARFDKRAGRLIGTTPEWQSDLGQTRSER